MPKIVDREGRREEVCAAAMRVLARRGPGALTLRSLAEELGGSITLVTYFFDDRADLFEAIVDDLLRAWDEDGTLAPSDDPMRDLRTLLEWITPAGPEEDDREAARVALIGLRGGSASIDHFFVAMEQRSRVQFARVLERIVPAEEVPRLVDVMRVGINGLVLSIVEHPEIWSPERRQGVIDELAAAVAAHRIPVASV